MGISEVDTASSEDLGKLRWAHERLTEMGYEPDDDEGHDHPIDWWEAHPAEWAAALESQANFIAETWNDNGAALAEIAQTLTVEQDDEDDED